MRGKEKLISDKDLLLPHFNCCLRILTAYWHLPVKDLLMAEDCLLSVVGSPTKLGVAQLFH